jgi:hypothetical protein
MSIFRSWSDRSRCALLTFCGAEKLVRGPDLQSFLPRPAVMITSHGPAVRLSPDHAGGLLAAAVSA